MSRKNRRSGSAGPNTAAAVAVAVLTPERRQHDHIEILPKSILDSNEQIGRPYLTENIIVRLHKAGDITDQERRAGEEFQRLFAVSGLHGIRASDPSRVTTRGMVENDLPPRCEFARNRISRALNAVGRPSSPARLVCWHVLGLGCSLREFEELEGWAPRRPLSREAAKGALVGALGILEDFFGLA